MLFRLAPGSWRRTNVSLSEVTPERVATRQRARVANTLSRAAESGCRSRSMNWETGLLKVGWRLEQHGLILGARQDWCRHNQFNSKDKTEADMQMENTRNL